MVLKNSRYIPKKFTLSRMEVRSFNGLWFLLPWVPASSSPKKIKRVLWFLNPHSLLVSNVRTDSSLIRLILRLRLKSKQTMAEARGLNVTHGITGSSQSKMWFLWLRHAFWDFSNWSAMRAAIFLGNSDHEEVHTYGSLSRDQRVKRVRVLAWRSYLAAARVRALCNFR